MAHRCPGQAPQDMGRGQSGSRRMGRVCRITTCTLGSIIDSDPPPALLQSANLLSVAAGADRRGKTGTQVQPFGSHKQDVAPRLQH
jgi:hypothetical protein